MNRAVKLLMLLVGLGVSAFMGAVVYENLSTAARASHGKRNMAEIIVAVHAIDRYRTEHATLPALWPAGPLPSEFGLKLDPRSVSYQSDGLSYILISPAQAGPGGPSFVLQDGRWVSWPHFMEGRVSFEPVGSASK